MKHIRIIIFRSYLWWDLFPKLWLKTDREKNAHISFISVVLFSCVTQGICDRPILATFPQKLIIYRCKHYSLLHSLFLGLNLIHYLSVFFLVRTNFKHPSMSIEHSEKHELQKWKNTNKNSFKKEFRYLTRKLSNNFAIIRSMHCVHAQIHVSNFSIHFVHIGFVILV